MNKFNGPVFIVGMPRSGTKLLRELLNNHSKLAFPANESEILPYWSKNWHDYGDLTKFVNFKRFYDETKKYPFFTYMYKQKSRIISAEEWYQACREGSVAEVFEALIRLDTKCSPEIIWGDKSPSYIKHIPLLKKIYPSAKVIHIVRDVRDYCLSINKAWGKNMLRAAQRWQDDTTQASQDIISLGKDGLEIRYEDLLTNPKTTLHDVCNFLEIHFEKQMMTLCKPVENGGDTKGSVKIVNTNQEKWRSQISPKLIYQIERICIPQLKKYKYPFTYEGKQVHISKNKLKIYRLIDIFNLILHDTDNRGIVNNIIFYLRHNHIIIDNNKR
jgi:hypothetical protein